MSMIKITLPAGEVPVDGKQVSFIAPCSSLLADGLQIDNENYIIVDAMNNIITGKDNVWHSGAIVSVLLDVTNKKAYIQNAASAASSGSSEESNLVNKVILVTIPVSGWSDSKVNGYYTNQVTVDEMKAAYDPYLDLMITSADTYETERSEFGMIAEAETFDGYVIFRAVDKPTMTLNVRFLGLVRIQEGNANTQTIRVSSIQIPTSAWSSDTSMSSDYPYKATISIDGIDSTWECKTFFPDHTSIDLDDLFYKVVNTVTNGIEVWASSIPSDSITIENISLEKVL